MGNAGLFLTKAAAAFPKSTLRVRFAMQEYWHVSIVRVCVCYNSGLHA